MSSEETPAVAWGRPDMSSVEALMWRIDTDPRLRQTMVAVLMLDRPPDWTRVVDDHDWGSRMVPRLRQRVVEAPLGIGTPAYERDDTFDLSYHLRRQRLAGDGTMRELLDLVQQIGVTPLDRKRPLWEAVLIDGFTDGRAAFVMKLHHSSMDGLGAMQLLGALLSQARDAPAERVVPALPADGHESPLGLLARKLARDVGGLAATVVQPATARALARPARTLRDAVGYTNSLRRILADPDAQASPLLKGRSLSWQCGALDVALADLKAAGKAGGGTVNDAYLAALLGGYRRYHAELDAPIDTIPMAIPVSTRRPDDAAGGNRFAGARLAGPAGIADPRERMAAIGRLVRSARDEVAIDGLGFVAPAMARLPGAALTRVVGSLARASDLQATNVPGLRGAVYLSGAKVERLYGYPPLPDCAAMISMVSHGDTCCVGVNTDPAAVTDGERFHRCLAEGFDEVLALRPGAAPAVVVA